MRSEEYALLKEQIEHLKEQVTQQKRIADELVVLVGLLHWFKTVIISDAAKEGIELKS